MLNDLTEEIGVESEAIVAWIRVRLVCRATLGQIFSGTTIGGIEEGLEANTTV